jgi:hypothetical protein
MARAVNGQKVCGNPKCEHHGKAQSVGNFTKDRRTVDGLDSQCKDCSRIENKRCREAYPKLYRKHRLKQYNLTLAQYDLMMLQQDRKCGLCHKEFSYNKDPKNKYYPVVHHDHDTGFVIGIWHRKCNNAEAWVTTVNEAISLAKYIQQREAITLLKEAA